MNPHQHEEIIRNWRRYKLPFENEPSLVKTFAGGKTNRSYLLQADSKLWVLRVGSDVEHLGVNRAREFTIQAAVAEIQLAPRILHKNSEPDFWLTEYIPGKIYTALSDDKITALFDALAKIRQLPLELPVFDYNQQLKILSGKNKLDDNLSRALETLNTYGATGLCHHDLNPNNVIFNGDRPTIIDWEYAAVGMVEMDFASVLLEWKIPLQTISALTGAHPSLLEAACEVYQALCQFWEQRQGIALASKPS